MSFNWYLNLLVKTMRRDTALKWRWIMDGWQMAKYLPTNCVSVQHPIKIHSSASKFFTGKKQWFWFKIYNINNVGNTMYSPGNTEIKLLLLFISFFLDTSRRSRNSCLCFVSVQSSDEDHSGWPAACCQLSSSLPTISRRLSQSS